MIDWELLLRALGLAFVLEGLLWALLPNAMCSMMAELLAHGPSFAQRVGLMGMGAGLLLLFFLS